MKEWTVGDLKEWHSSLSDADKATTTTKHPFCDHETFVRQWLTKAKLLSQVIASSWLEGEKAANVRKIFTQFSTGHNDSDLKDLLTGKKPELWDKRVFDDNEIKMYQFEVSWDTFEGKILEHHQAVPDQKPPYFTIVLPYPPRPALSEFTVTLDKIQNWVNAPIEEDEDGLIKNPYPPYPYIPTTST
jgi:hypothetical protein